MVRPSASVGIGIALFLGCAKPAEPLAAGPAPSATSTLSAIAPADRPLCEVAERADARSPAQWRRAIASTKLVGYVFVVEATPPTDERVARAVDELGALETHVARCSSVLVVWLPATNLSLAVEIEEALVGKTGARLREKAIVAPSS